MEIDENRFYYKRDLIAYLKSQDLPHSQPTIIKYEKLGIIPSPRNSSSSNNWRLYTGKELKDIANSLREKMKPKHG